MTHRPRAAWSALATSFALIAPLALAADDACRPPPLGERVLYLRGSFNDWRADDDKALRYVCDHYELLARIEGKHAFKVGDEVGAADADLGAPGDVLLEPGTPQPLTPRAGALHAHFAGVTRVTLILPLEHAADLMPTLRVEALPADTPVPAPPAATLTDPIARSLAFDSRALADKSPFGAVAAGAEVAFALGALPGVEQVTLVVEKRRLEGNYDVLAYDELARVPLVRATAGERERWSGRFKFGAPAVYTYWFEARIG
ncbi:MAG: hypothetical protein ABJD97_15860, partial [Betaproteobacteria bacterium]